MRLHVINSGSAGNSYLLTSSNGERLLIELGCDWNAIKKVLDFDYDNVGAITSHGHFDHSKSIPQAVKCGIQVYANEHTLDCKGMLGERGTTVIEPGLGQFTHGSFTFQAFDLIHDVPTQGYVIHHPECGTICFITDTREADFYFPGVRHWLIEANFGEDILVDRVWRGSNSQLAERVAGAHMSVEECERVLLSQDLSDTETILLLHLSDSNSHARNFQDRITKATGRPVYIADKGVIIDL